MIFREENDGKYVQGVLFEKEGRLYEAKLYEECFDLLKEATAIIDDLEHMPRIEQDSLRLITLVVRSSRSAQQRTRCRVVQELLICTIS